MLSPRHCPCCVPGCTAVVRLTALVTVLGPLDPTDGICRRHLATVDKDLRALLRAARRELRARPHLAEAVLFVRAWRAVAMQAAAHAEWGVAA